MTCITWLKLATILLKLVFTLFVIFFGLIFHLEDLAIGLQTVEPLVAIIGEICNESGLDFQNYQCKACSRPVGICKCHCKTHSYVYIEV